MAARTLRPKHSDEKRFYVYALSDVCGVVRYVGKGSGYRLNTQVRNYGLKGEIIGRFSSELAAYREERKAIKRLNPDLNRNRGGGGPRHSAPSKRRTRYLEDIERIGTVAYAARLVLRFGRCFIHNNDVEFLKMQAKFSEVR